MTTALSPFSLSGLKSEIGDLIDKLKLEWKIVLLPDLQNFDEQNKRGKKGKSMETPPV